MTPSLQVLEEGIELCNTKSIKKGITKLVEQGYMSDSPEHVVAFIRLAGDRLNAREVIARLPCTRYVETSAVALCLWHARQVGDFLGDIGRNDDEKHWYHNVRTLYMSGLDFTGMPFDQALRFLLTNAGFFLPGESQKIDRLTQVCWMLRGADRAYVTRC